MLSIVEAFLLRPVIYLFQRSIIFLNKVKPAVDVEQLAGHEVAVRRG